MAKAPGHQFGQLIGHLVEEIVHSTLDDFAKKYGYYLDKQGARGKARKGNKVTWLDKYDCEHDLDFVIEKNGSADQRGRPLAFIETAWRRYTKHSKNKAQEIQGAILPTAEKYWSDAPFLGVVLVGIFTAKAITQMEKTGFRVLYVHRSAIMGAFERAGIPVNFDESTPDKDFKKAVRGFNELTPSQLTKFKNDLREIMKADFDSFISKLEAALARQINKIVITPLFGNSTEFLTARDAKTFLEKSLPDSGQGPLLKIDVLVCYDNGSRIDASFRKIEEIRAFLDYVAA